MNIQHLALQLGNSPVTGPSCSQEHLRNTVQRTASSSTLLIQFQIEKMEKKCMVSLFIYIWHIRKEVFKPRQPLPGMANRVLARDNTHHSQAPQALLCIWFRCQILLQRMEPLLSPLPWVGAAQGDGSARPHRLWVTLTYSTGDTAAITSSGWAKSRLPANIPGVSLEAAVFPHVCSQERFLVLSQRKAGTHTSTPSSHTRPTSPPSLLPGTEGTAEAGEHHPLFLILGLF